MKTSDWINLVIALGTLALAVVAIWGDRIKSWVAFGPQLSLEPVGIGAVFSVGGLGVASTLSRNYRTVIRRVKLDSGA